MDGTLSLETSEVANNQQVESSDDEDVFEKLRTLRNNQKLNDQNESAGLDPFDSLKENTTTLNEVIEETEEVEGELPDVNTSVGSKRNRIRNVIDSDSEEEHANVEDMEEDTECAKRSRQLSDSDSEKPITKRTRIIDSDED